MHKIVATAMALPALAQTYVSTLGSTFRRQPAQRKAVAIGLVAVLVIGTLVTGAAALAPSNDPTLGPTGTIVGGIDMAPNAPFQIHFTKAMDQGSVSQSVRLSPATSYRQVWDGSGRVLSLLPNPVWAPYTYYAVAIDASARDQDGRAMNSPIQSSFQTGSRTAAQITATIPSGAQVAPTTAFQISFTRPVKLVTVMLKLVITPEVPVTITGNDAADQTSQVFTLTPKSILAADTSYSVHFVNQDALDTTGSTIQPVTSLQVHTLAAAKVVRFRPFDRGYAFDPNQPVSVRFTTPMDTTATTAAFSVEAGGHLIGGQTYWVENDTVLVMLPATPFIVGQRVIARVSKAAKSADGRAIASEAMASFNIARPEVKNIPWTGGAASSSSPWYASEVYYLRLVNCTRTGGWVTPSGACSTSTHHTMPAQNPLTLDRGISNLVSRPYAKYMADNKLLDHFLNGTTPHYRLSAQGWTSGNNGENIAKPGSGGKAGMVAVEIFFQNESPCRCEHYLNIMYPYFHTAGIGVWVSSKTHMTRVVMDFYGG